MGQFTIETTYDLPMFRHRTFEADTLADACRMALDDEEWDDARADYETSGPTRLTGAWAGPTAYQGDQLRTVGAGLSTFDEIRAALQLRFDEVAVETMADLATGDCAPELELAIGAALDIVARGLLEVRSRNAPA